MHFFYKWNNKANAAEHQLLNVHKLKWHNALIANLQSWWATTDEYLQTKDSDWAKQLVAMIFYDAHEVCASSQMRKNGFLYE